MTITHLQPRMLAAVLVAAALTACGGSTVSNISLGGSVSGLSVDGLVLSDGLGSVSIAANATSFTFPSRVNVGYGYTVTVQTQPAGLTCSVANASGTTGTSDIATVQVTCVPNHSLGGSITGLTAGGLVLANGSDTVSPAANATSFVFPARIGENAAYGVTVLAQPAGQNCTVVNGSGYMGTADLTGVQVNCT